MFLLPNPVGVLQRSLEHTRPLPFHYRDELEMERVLSVRSNAQWASFLHWSLV